MLKKPAFWITATAVLLIALFIIIANLDHEPEPDPALHASNLIPPHEVDFVGFVTQILTENVQDTGNTKTTPVGYRVHVLMPCISDLQENDIVDINTLYKRKNPEDGPEELSVGDIIIVTYYDDQLYKPTYEDPELSKSKEPYVLREAKEILYGEHDTLLNNKWRSKKLVELINDIENIPKDFSFTLEWDSNGRSTYNSLTGKLIKERWSFNPGVHTISDYTTEYFLSDMSKAVIYYMIKELDLDSYPERYDPYNGDSSIPSETVTLTVKYGDYSKMIICPQIKMIDYSYISFHPENTIDKKAEQYVNLIKTIVRLLTESDEWKALPDYDHKEG